MFSKFDEETQKIILSAKKEMQDLKHPYVGSEHLMLAILKDKNEVSTKLKEFGIDYKKFKNEIINIIGVGSEASDWFLYTPLLKRTLENAVNNTKDNNVDSVTISDLFYSVLEEGEGVAIRILLGMNVDIDKLYNYFSKNIQKKKQSRKKSVLDELAINLNNKAKEGLLDPVIGREKEINRMLEILCRRTKNNPILIGDAGVGKTAIVEELANRIVSGNVPALLKNKKILCLDMASSIAGTKYRGEFEDRMKKILSELEEDNNIILFIDEIHTIMGAGGAEGAIDASNIFKPALARGKMRCIGATTRDEYKKFIEKDGALDRRFQKVDIKAPDEKSIKDILMKLKSLYEKHHEVSISEKMIDKIIMLSKKYIRDRNEPDRSIDILDEVCAKVSLKENKIDKKLKSLNEHLTDIRNKKNKAIIDNRFNDAYEFKQQEDKIITQINNIELKINTKNKIVTEEDIIEVIKNKINIPILSLTKEHIEKIGNKLNENIFGQNKAIEELLNMSKRMQLDYGNSTISLLFCGKTGTGKTQLAKLYGEELVGKDNVIKLDMSEFAESHSISKIIGAPPGYVGYQDTKNVLEEIKDKPNAVLILDEIERASKNILNLFLQILDEGYTKDSKGRIIYFDNVTIIMTSNIGFDKNSLGFSNKSGSSTNKLKDVLGVEFINRISKVVSFEKVDEEVIEKIICKKINDLKNKYNIALNISNEVIKEMIEESQYDLFGARKIEELIIRNIESIIIDELILGNKYISIDSLKDKIIA